MIPDRQGRGPLGGYKIEMDQQIEVVRNWFNRIYLGGIPLLMRNDTAFLAFVCTLTAIEALAGYRYPEEGKMHEAGERFCQFVGDYFPAEYRQLAGFLYCLWMLHDYCCRLTT